MPGSERVYDPSRKQWEDASAPPTDPSYLPFGGGWLVGVAARPTGKQRDAAIDFARYLVSPETASRVRADRDFPMLPVRSSQLGQGPPDPRAAPGVDARQWSDAVSQTLIAAPGRPRPADPARPTATSPTSARGRVAAVAGEPAEPCPARRSPRPGPSGPRRSAPSGRLWHYRRSLNTLVTAPEPPER